MGLPVMIKGQSLRIKKGVFGLATAPRQRWATLRDSFLELKLTGPAGEQYFMKQSPIAPALFLCHSKHGQLLGIVRHGLRE